MVGDCKVGKMFPSCTSYSHFPRRCGHKDTIKFKIFKKEILILLEPIFVKQAIK